MNDLVSVIIPVFNAQNWIRKTIESVLSQEFLKEIILVDDHSTDNTFFILEDFKSRYPEKIKVFKNPLKGSNNARNFGFSKSSGEFIQWLDADDQLLADKFKKQVDFLLKNPETDIVYSDWFMDFYDENFSFIERRPIKKDFYDDYLYELLKDNWSPPANYLLRRSIAEKLNWDPNTPIAQDREYFTLAALNGAKFSYVPGFFSVYNRWSKNQISSIDFKKRLEFQILLEKKFRDIILNKNFPKKKQKKYLACLNAHLLNACFYHPKLTIPYLFSLLNVNWKIIHWKKYPFIPAIYIYQILKFLLRKKN